MGLYSVNYQVASLLDDSVEKVLFILYVISNKLRHIFVINISNKNIRKHACTLYVHINNL